MQERDKNIKTCTRCHRSLFVDNFRWKNKLKQLRHSVCNDCNKVYFKEYYNKNSEYHRERARKWISDNLNRKRERNALYMREYRTKKAEQVREGIKNHYLNNKDVYKTRAKLRRNREFGWIDSNMVKKVRAQFNYSCYACGSDSNLALDHHKPLSEGGQLVPGNLTILCRKCNNNKRFNDIYTDSQKLELSIKHTEQMSWVSLRDFIIESGINRELIKSLHYMKSCSASKYSYLLKYNGRTVGVAVFSRPSRQNIKADLELSRFFVLDGTPKNTESYFLGNVLKLLKKEGFRGIIVSYSDTSEGHEGIIYQATNWTLDGYTSINYHYRSECGNRIHKRQVWNRAKQNGISEKEQAQLENLVQIKELPKKRFLYRIY